MFVKDIFLQVNSFSAVDDFFVEFILPLSEYGTLVGRASVSRLSILTIRRHILHGAKAGRLLNGLRFTHINILLLWRIGSSTKGIGASNAI